MGRLRSSGQPFWISNQGTSTTSLYSVTGSTGVAPANLFPLARDELRSHPAWLGRACSGPTGQVANSAMTSFGITGGPALFIFANLNGTISAWNGSNVNPGTKTPRPSSRPRRAPFIPGWPSTARAIRLFAANGATGAIDVFNGSFAPTAVPGGFVDPSLPAGFVPFNVEDMGGKVYVTYAPAGRDAQLSATAGMGVVAVFDENGNFQQNLVTGGPACGAVGHGHGARRIRRIRRRPAGWQLQLRRQRNQRLQCDDRAFEGTIDVNPGAGDSPGGLWDLIFGSGGSRRPDDPLPHRRHRR